MPRFLITGANGFVGAHLTRRLVESGSAVSMVVRPGADLSPLADLLPYSQVLQADMRDRDAVCAAVQAADPQVVFHLAAPPDAPARLSGDKVFYESITLGTLYLLQALQGRTVHAIVLAGSAKEYGGGPVPYREDQLLQPVTPYAVAKVAATLMGQMIYRSLGLPVVTVRLFLTYGPGQPLTNLIPQAIQAALQGERLRMTAGEQSREFNYVGDVVDGLLAAARTPSAAGGVFNLCSGLEMPVRQVVERIYALTGCSVSPDFGALPYRSAETWHFVGDPAHSKAVLGWQTATSLEEGLEATVVWYTKNLRQRG